MNLKIQIARGANGAQIIRYFSNAAPTTTVCNKLNGKANSGKPRLASSSASAGSGSPGQKGVKAAGPAFRSSAQIADVLLRVKRQADLLDQFKLGLEEVDMLFLVMR